jgi:drug/metabolite transporter (DMT)-like permease
VDVVLLAITAGVLFGALTVAVRRALGRARDPEAGAFVCSVVGFAVALVIAVPAAARGGVELDGLWGFVLVGAIVPGLSQILFVRAVRDAGASRTAVVIGTAPLLSAALAVLLLDEPLRGALAAATLAIVLGSALLVWEPSRPADLRAVGLVLAFAAAILFAGRDNAVRWISRETDADPLLATSVSLGAAALALLAYLLVVQGRRPLRPRLRAAAAPFLPAGLCLGLAYTVLILAFSRGDVTVVAPLNATQSLWGVLLAAVVLGRAEAVGPRLFAASLLVVVGGIIVGVTR